MVMGAQMGKTELLLNLIGHRLDDDPAPILYISPTQRQAESISRDRLMKLLSSTPTLWTKLAKGQENKLGEKWISGVRLGFAWAGSATELASHPAALVLVDERDRMTEDTGGEGDPVALAEARTSTFPDGKVVICSTPTLEGASPIWRLWEEGTQFRWSWPCPDCGEFFHPRLELLSFPDDATPAQAQRLARLACPACGAEIDDSHRLELNRLGRYLAPGERVLPGGEIEGEPPDSDTASFWVSGLCSPWRSFGQRAKALVEAKRSGTPGRLQAIINTGFGELYQETGEAPDWQEVAARRGAYVMGSVPPDVQMVTAGVDVQKNRLVYVVRGWGANSESWLLLQGELWGETDQEPVWELLGGLIQRGVGQSPIRRTFIDSGFNTQAVYAFSRQHRGRAYPAKGHDQLEKPIRAVPIDVTYRGRTIRNGLTLWHLDSDFFKTWIHSRIQWPVDQPGGFHLPANATDDYCKQLVSEQRLVRPNGKVQWITVQRDNHYLDAEGLAAAAAHSLAVYALRGQQDKPQGRQQAEETQPRPERQQQHRSPWINYDRGAWLRR